jgi:N6-adenosine-specific RNA methylase IME4
MRCGAFHRVEGTLCLVRHGQAALSGSKTKAPGFAGGYLLKYEALKAALAEALTIDEVKDIRDRAEAMRAYARMANDVQLELDAGEYRVRAERRLGELMAAQSRAGLLSEGGRPKKTGSESDPVCKPITLAEAGIDKHLADRARKLAALPDELFEAALNRVRDKIEAQKRVSLDIAAQDKKERRAQREADLGTKQSALPQQKFGVVVADPEWRFEPWSRATGMDRAADNHYPTSCTEVIAARDVPSIAADDCVLFLWATAPMFLHAAAVMDAWGFIYKTHCIWRKPRAITGYWFRFAHELLLVGTKGNIPAPAMGTQSESVLDAPSPGPHSGKPELFLEEIERLFPTLPKIELNRRGPPRPGWSAWGFEAQQEDAA